jgi:hypothetical protein
MRRVPQVSTDDIEKGGIAFSCPCRCGVSDNEQSESDDPQSKAKANRGGERSIENGDSARRAGDQDRLSQGAMNGSIKPRG